MRQKHADRIRGKVAQRARQLDALVPGWEHKVNPERLDLLDNRRCVLGQVYGHVDSSPYAFTFPFGARWITSGFAFLSWESLALGTKCWREQVLARKQGYSLYVPSGWEQEQRERDEPVVLPLPGEPDVPWEDAGV